MIAFDAAKDQANIAKHGVSLSRAADFVMEMARSLKMTVRTMEKNGSWPSARWTTGFT